MPANQQSEARPGYRLPTFSAINNRHEDHVLIVPIDECCRFHCAFFFEAESLVKRNRTLVVGVNSQLEADKSNPARFAQRGLNKRSSIASPAKRREEGHSQHAAVGVNWTTLWN